jgi:hypothetical protein
MTGEMFQSLYLQPIDSEKEQMDGFEDTPEEELYYFRRIHAREYL